MMSVSGVARGSGTGSGRRGTLVFRTRPVSVAVAGSGVVAMVLCVSLTIKYNYYQSTWITCTTQYVTHKAAARNYLPIVSTSAGSFYPQTYIWKCLVGNVAFFSLLQLATYYNHFRAALIPRTPPSDTKARKWPWRWSGRADVFSHLIPWALPLMVLARILEVLFGLHGLTMISTRENFPAHELLTYVFVLSCFVYIGCQVFLTYAHNALVPRPTRDTRRGAWLPGAWSLSYRVYVGIAFVVCHVIASSSYFYHIWYCDDGVYTIFSVCEYFSVLLNAAFHFTVYWDFGDCLLIVGKCGGAGDNMAAGPASPAQGEQGHINGNTVHHAPKLKQR